MTEKNNLQVASADFDQIKRSLKEYMKANSGLNDVDFEGSGAAVLLDILAYNSFYNNVYLNAATNEMFLDTAVQRANVVAHAAPLGYVPRSFTAARITGDLVVTPNDTPIAKYITLPTNTVFLTKIENRSYKFQNLASVNLELKSDGKYHGDVTLYEGNQYTYRYNVNLSDKDQRFKIPSTDIDVDLITVGVIRNSQYSEYSRSLSITNVIPTSKIYTLKQGDDSFYEVIFGDGVFGEDVSQGDIVVLEYFVCNGAIPNGATLFDCQTSVGGYSNVVFNGYGSAAAGAVSEDIESIRQNATKFFETQNRAVTWSDYETLLMKEFGFLETVSVWGGEDNEPPFYGRVFVSGKPIVGETLTSSEVQVLTDYVKSKNIAPVSPIFVQPEYLYLKFNSVVRFRSERSPYTISEANDRVRNAITEFVDVQLEKFGQPFKYSNLLTTIDDSAIGITSNLTDITYIKRIIPSFDERNRYVIQFGAPLEVKSISSNGFVSDLSSETIYLESAITTDATGEYPITYYYIRNNSKVSVEQKIGSVDYENGIVSVNFLIIRSIVNDYSLNIEVTPENFDYYPKRNVIISARAEDISVSVTPETSK